MQPITLENLLYERSNQNFSNYQSQAHSNWEKLLNTQL